MSIDGNGYVTTRFVYPLRIIDSFGVPDQIIRVAKSMDREKRAAAYRAKSDESFAAAKICVDKQLYRAACNRAWYATMQIITAAAYQELAVKPIGDKLSFSHASQPKVFGDLLEASGRLDYAYLRVPIRECMNRREIADYHIETSQLGLADAKKSISTADEVRRIVSQIVGPAWQ